MRPREIMLLAQMVRLLIRYSFVRSKLPLPQLIARFDAACAHPNQGARTDLRRLTIMIDSLMRFVYRDRYCMKRSLLHFHYLRKWGYGAEIHFGVTRKQDGIDGHAWIELGGRPYAERSDPRTQFVRTYSYPAP